MLVPAPSSRGGLQALRTMRVIVDPNGALVVQHPDGRQDVRAAPGTVTGISYVAGRTNVHGGVVPRLLDGGLGIVVIRVEAQPVLALHLAQWLPGVASVESAADALRISGVEALAHVFGLAVTPLNHSPDVRAVMVSPQPTPPSWWSWVGCTAVGLVAVTVLVAGVVGAVHGDRAPTWLQALYAATAMAAALLVVMTLVLRRRARAASGGATLPGRTIEPVPSGPVPCGFLDNARLAVDGEMIVLRDRYGREAWMPGPAAGGLVRASWTAEALVLDDVRGTGWAALPRSAWFATSRAEDVARAALDEAGLSVVDEPSARAPGAWFAGPHGIPVRDSPSVLSEATGEPRWGMLAGLPASALFGVGALWSGAHGMLSAITVPAGITGVLAAAAGSIAALLAAWHRHREARLVAAYGGT